MAETKESLKVKFDEKAVPGNTQVIHLDPVGSSGTDLSGGILNEEYLVGLTGREASDCYDKMRRSDPTIKMNLNAISGPLKKGTWTIEPGIEDDPEQEKMRALVENAIFYGHDKGWRRFLHEILSCITFGYSLFERTHQVIFDDPEFGTHIRWKNFGFRSQRTIERWNVDEDRNLESVTQMAFGDAQPTNVDLPARFLTLFSIDQEGDNFEGISMLRPCYGAWLRKNTYLKLEAIGTEKYAVPTPVLTVPDGEQNSAKYNRAVAVLQRFLSHQSNYLTKIEGWDLDLVTTEFDASKIRGSIKEENAEMTMAFLANFLLLGQNQSGSYALSFDLSDFFLSGIEYIGDQICEVFNEQLIPELIDLNFGPQQKYPYMKVSGISDRLGEEFGKLLKSLSDGNYITPDDNLEKYLRDRLKLPEMDQATARQEPEPSKNPQFSEKKSPEKGKVIIVGGPRSGKSTLARDSGLPVYCTDPINLVKDKEEGVTYLPEGMEWSEASQYVVDNWFPMEGNMVIEGIGTVRALRKAIKQGKTKGLENSKIIKMTGQYEEAVTKKGQVSLAKGVDTVWDEVKPQLASISGLKIEE